MIRLLARCCGLYASLGAARLIILAFALLIAPLAAEAQAPGKVWRVAVLTGGLPRSSAPIHAVEQRLAELGYVEGRNLVIDFRTAGGGRTCSS